MTARRFICRAGRAIQKEEGMASILMVFAVVLLCLFAVLTFSSGRANANLSKKAARWASEYYTLDAFAEIKRAEFEACLSDAEAFAKDYVLSHGYEKESYAGLPESQGLIAAEFKTGSASATRIAEAAERVYAYQCIKTLQTLKAKQEELVITLSDIEEAALFDLDKPSPNYSAMKLGYLISQQNVDTPKMLSVTLRISEPDFVAEKTEQGYAIKRGPTFLSRFALVEWAQYQPPFDMNQAQKWWDGRINVEK